MAVVGIRQLSRETSRVIQEFEESGEPVIVTREGRPIGALMPVGEAQLQDLVLELAPEFRAGHNRAGEEVEEGGERSLAEAAAARGIELEGGEVDISPMVEGLNAEEVGRAATEAELRPFSTILNQSLAGRVLGEASDEVGDLSSETLSAIGGSNPDESEVREVTSATASVYGRLLRHQLRRAIARAAAPDDILKATQFTSRKLRAMSKPLIETPNLSIDDYKTALRNFEIVWASGAEVEEDETPLEEGAS
jgi:prevent-host-death family protein